MSIEAIWTIRFGPIEALESELNGGVAMIESQRVFGGDAGYAYVGDIAVVAQTVNGKLTIKRHNPSWTSMYNRDEDEFQLTFSGTLVSDSRIEGHLFRPGFPSARLLLTRFAELP